MGYMYMLRREYIDALLASNEAEEPRRADPIAEAMSEPAADSIAEPHIKGQAEQKSGEGGGE